MANYTGPDPNNLLPGEPWTSQLALASFEDPVAIAEGAEGAPLISGAIRKIITGQEIGAFIFARGPSTTAYGDVVAGSSLTYAGALSNASAGAVSSEASLESFSFGAGNSGSPSGSWVCLGRIQATATARTIINPTNNSATAATLWQRVA